MRRVSRGEKLVLKHMRRFSTAGFYYFCRMTSFSDNGNLVSYAYEIVAGGWNSGIYGFGADERWRERSASI